MKKVTSDLLIIPKFVKTRTKRIGRSSECDFCHKRFRDKELRMCYRTPWSNIVRDPTRINYHQVCYMTVLHITALALFQEINDYGRNYKRKRNNSTP